MYKLWNKYNTTDACGKLIRFKYTDLKMQLRIIFSAIK